MVPTTTLAAVAVAVGLPVAVAAAYVVRRRDAEATAATGNDNGTESRERRGGSDPPAEGVTCPYCGTPNQADYRFCRSCTADLSATAPDDAAGSVTARRGV